MRFGKVGKFAHLAPAKRCKFASHPAVRSAGIPAVSTPERRCIGTPRAGRASGIDVAVFGDSQTIVCMARAQPQAKQSVASRKNRLPSKPKKQPSNATEPVLIGYARVSRTEGQDLTPQIDALEAAGCRRIHEERASGGRWDRPELTRLLERLAAGDVLVVWKLDRLSRSLKDLLLILERIGGAGAGFRSLTEAIDTTVPAGRMMMQMLGAFAEYEREMVKERTQAGLKAARAQGRHGGRRPKFTQAQRAEILSMLAVGRSAAEVARLFQAHRATISRSTQRHVKPRQSEQPCSCYVRKFGRKSVEPCVRAKLHAKPPAPGT
jgi:DNA invertase Pin-like site-specific DNA recombinase